MHRCRPLVLLITLAILAITWPAGGGHTAPGVVSAQTAQASPSAVQAQAALIIENTGQLPPQVRYRTLGNDSQWAFADDGVWVISRAAGSQQGLALRLTFPGADLSAGLQPLNRAPGAVSSFVGNDATRWQSSLAVWAGVVYRDLYPGVDLVISSTGGLVEMVAHARDLAALANVRLQVEGADSVTVVDGQVQVGSTLGRLKLPLLRAVVAGQPLSGALLRPLTVDGFVIDSPFASAPLGGAQPAAGVPAASDLVYSTFLGGRDHEWGLAEAVDGAGNLYLAGMTMSDDFPTTPGVYAVTHTVAYGGDIFVAKLNAGGSALLWATFLGGAGNDRATAIAVDAAGNVNLTGWTQSPDFPVTALAPWPARRSEKDAFVARLNSSGSILLYSTFLGGSQDDEGTGIAVGADLSIYVAGTTSSADFPSTPGSVQPAFGGGDCYGFPCSDAFVVKLNPFGFGLVYGTFLGRADSDEALALRVNSSGEAYVAGRAGWEYPTTSGAFDRHFAFAEGFVTKLSVDGSSLVFSTYLGGDTNDDVITALALDADGNVYVTGHTMSRDFPTTAGCFSSEFKGGYILGDAFVAKLNPSGSQLLYGTYLGGRGDDSGGTANGDDSGYAIAVDSRGHAYVTGYTESRFFPTTPDPFDATFGGYGDAFLAKLSRDGSSLMHSTFLGGWTKDIAYALALDNAGNAYVSGETVSNDFPVTAGAFDRSLNDGRDAFVTKLSPTGLSVSLHRPSVALWPGQEIVVGLQVRRAADLGSFSISLNFDPAVVTVTNVALGPFLGSTGRAASLEGPVYAENGVTFGGVSSGSAAGPSGGGTLAWLTLSAVGYGRSPITISSATLGAAGELQQELDRLSGGVVTVVAFASALPVIVR